MRPRLEGGWAPCREAERDPIPPRRNALGDADQLAEAQWTELQREADAEVAAAVEFAEAMSVGGKVRRHPVEDHTDAGVMAGVDELGEIMGVAVARTRRELREQLVTPGATEGMLHDRHQLDVGEAHVNHVGDQPLGQLVPVVQPAVIATLTSPRPGMQLVDAHRRLE